MKILYLEKINMTKYQFLFLLWCSANLSLADSKNFTCKEIDGKKMSYFFAGQFCGESRFGQKDNGLSGVQGICLQEVECAYGPNGIAEGRYYPSTIICLGKRKQVNGKYYNACPSAGDCKAENMLTKKEAMQMQDEKIIIQERDTKSKSSDASNGG